MLIINFSISGSSPLTASRKANDNARISTSLLLAKSFSLFTAFSEIKSAPSNINAAEIPAKACGAGSLFDPSKFRKLSFVASPF